MSAQASTTAGERLADAALKLFAEKGFAAVSIRDIAAEAGVPSAQIYYYFGSKEQLYVRLLSDKTAALAERVVSATGDVGSPLERLERFVDAYLEYVGSDTDGALFVTRELAAVGSHLFREAMFEFDTKIRQSLRSILQDGASEGIFRDKSLSLCAIAIMGILSTFARRIKIHAGAIAPDDVKAQVLDFYIHGLAPR